MKLIITTTLDDEMDEVVNLEIPNRLHDDVMSLPGLRLNKPNHGVLQEIPLITADEIAELVDLDLGDISGVRCWLQA